MKIVLRPAPAFFGPPAWRDVVGHEVAPREAQAQEGRPGRG